MAVSFAEKADRARFQATLNNNGASPSDRGCAFGSLMAMNDAQDRAIAAHYQKKRQDVRSHRSKGKKK